MYSSLTTTKLYRDFAAIDEDAYHTLIRFYEANQTGINALNFDDCFEIKVTYANALFEIGAYEKHIVEAASIVRLSIHQNIQFYKGEDIYFKNLYQKAISYYRLLKFEQAEHILKELIKIAPQHHLSIQLLKKCLLHSQPNYIKKARAASIILFLVATLITAIEVLIIYPFLPEKASLFEAIRIGLFMSGIFILIGAFGFHRHRVLKKVNQFVLACRNK